MPLKQIDNDRITDLKKMHPFITDIEGYDSGFIEKWIKWFL